MPGENSRPPTEFNSEKTPEEVCRDCLVLLPKSGSGGRNFNPSTCRSGRCFRGSRQVRVSSKDEGLQECYDIGWLQTLR